MSQEHKKIERLVFVFVAAAAASSGCGLFGGSKNEPPPPPCDSPEALTASLSASARLNPGEQGEGLATVVRLYQLKGSSKLMDLGFDDVLEKDKDALGDTFVSVEEMTLQPGETRGFTGARSPEATHVALVALFRQPAGTSWRAVHPLAPPDPNHCRRHKKTGGAPRATVTAVLDENRIELR